MSQQAGGAVVQTARTVHHHGIAVVVVSGEIDRMTDDPALNQAVEAVRGAPTGLVLDLGGVSFFGSAGINMVVAVRREAQRAKVPFRVVAASKTVLRPLELSGVNVLLTVHPNLAEALSGLGTLPRQRRV
ncbi:STAS domain-containing protein [Lentzea sp. NPDC042327]|uniref:STAS domain-containing protein n=1 Tax=Lentzea sp. NPDC042327 TaxID=3154801 RepID=UPI00340C6861